MNNLQRQIHKNQLHDYGVGESMLTGFMVIVSLIAIAYLGLYLIK